MGFIFAKSWLKILVYNTEKEPDGVILLENYKRSLQSIGKSVF